MKKGLSLLALVAICSLGSNPAVAITVSFVGGCKTGGTCYCTKPGKPKGLLSKTYTSKCYLVAGSGQPDRFQSDYKDGQRAEGAIASCLANCLGKEDVSPRELDKYKSLIKEKPVTKKK